MRVYLIKNLLNGALYVGQTCQSLKSRWNGHRQRAKQGATSPLYEAIRLFGPQAFTIEELQNCSDPLELGIAEAHWISTLNTQDPLIGYNRSTGGVSATASPETRAKLSVRLKGKSKSRTHREKLAEAGKGLTGDKNPFFGKRHTPETKEKIANTMRGEKGPHYGRTGVKHPMFGTQHSETTRRKMSSQRKGRALSEHQKSRILEGKQASIAKTAERNQKILQAATEGLTASEISSRFGLKIKLVYNILSKLRNS